MFPEKTARSIAYRRSRQWEMREVIVLRVLKSRVIWSAVFVLLLANRLPAQRGPAVVVVAPVVEREVTAGHSFVGSVEPFKRATIGSAVDGRVTEFPVEEGDRIRGGQSLAKLLTATIELELKAAEGELAFRQESLKELKNGTRPGEIVQLRARMLAAKARREFLVDRRARFTALARQGTVTEDDLAAVISAAITAERDFDDAKAGHELAVAGPRAEKLVQAGARLAVQQAVVEQLKDRITKHTIVSRFDGYITSRRTEVGEWVSRGDPVVDVVSLDQVDVKVSVLESQVPHLRIGTSVRVEIMALPQQVLTGTIATIIPQGDQRTRTFPVKIRLSNTITEGRPLIKAGMLSRVTLPTGARTRALLVPKDALVLGGRSPVVYVVGADKADPKKQVVRLVPVRLGVASGSLIQVTGEIAAGQQVVVQGNERLRPGQSVSPRPAPAGPRSEPTKSAGSRR
ncbi:MAG TPA: efflux RND transporter periplasmic adaptor subunit [Planctomycetaceae bacterium]|nr:efflux RND transporter periplasmic adaptor subunit [Planctomycetaceae bacterium]HCK54305.1 efflux RND transporter periplasmic adaptor subunit [Planctomycetaceae bacterium]